MQSILYIDDEPHSLTAFRLTFQDEFRIFTANDTQEGYEILKSQEIQLVVTDQRMPEETGVEFLNRIRDEFPKTVRTILTGYSDIEAIIEAINESHIYYYFQKPWNESELKLAFKNAIEAAGLAAENRRLVSDLKKALLQVELKSEELRERLNEREILVKDLEKANEVKSQFLSVISHELRTPLNPIIGLSDMMAKTLEGPEDQSNLELINRCGNNLLGMINSILEFVQIGHAQDRDNIEPIDISRMVNDCVTLARTTLPSDTQIAVLGRTMIDGIATGESPVVHSRPENLRQILQNLVVNACKFTKAGRIEISADIVTKSSGTHELTLSVQDTGIGIAKEDAARIFEVFTQVDQSLARGYDGLGLGLAICKQLSDGINAEIELESEPGKGSVFRLLIPIQRFDEAPHSHEEDFSTVGEFSKRHALVVESNPQSMSTMRVMLRKLGCQVATAESGADALEALVRQEFDFVFMELSLPDITGPELAGRIRQMSLSQQPQIIAVSEEPEGEEEASLEESEIDKVQYKPLSFSDLSDHLEQATSKA